jgi:uncharacterized membrane protein
VAATAEVTGAARLLVLLLVALLAPASAQVDVGDEGPGQPVNALCPVLPDEAVDPELTVEWEGQTVGFCCRKCQRLFQEDPQPYLGVLAGMLAAEGQAAAELETEPPGAAPQEREEAGLLAHLHPVLVHFPIALLLAAALAELLGQGRAADGGASPVARYCLSLAALTAVLAALSGWGLAEDHLALPGTEVILERHRWLGLSTAGLAVITFAVGLVAGKQGPRLRLYRWLLLLAAVVVAITGHMGGMLVYGPDFPFD